MLKRMCRTPPCSQAALSTVHQRPRPNTGTAPLAPNTKRAGVDGENILSRPPMPMFPREKISVRA
jgi:hypothetical protein